MNPAIQSALQHLNGDLAELDAWLQALDAGEQPAPWVFAMRRLFDRLDSSAQALESSLRTSGQLGERAP
ncbi:MAG: hypothetical protein RLZZ126_763 [Pseudomonadota bacterium]|jgi:hypothetical protein